MTDFSEGDATLLAHYEHDALSRRTALTYGNGTSTVYNYEIDNDLSSLFLQFNASSANLTYTYDNTGNRQNFTADDDRFIYSPLADINNTYVPNNLNQYTSVGGIPFGYDSNGSLTSDGINAYSYDPENRLITAYTPAHSIDYSYDPLGRRISKTVDGTETSYLYDSDQVIMEYDGSGQMIRRYVYGTGIDEPICMQTGASTYFYHFNALGSVIALSNASGDMVETYAYSPYGKVNQASTVGNPYLFTGRRYDPETGLYYYRARYYDAESGRFLQVDPIGYVGGINLYAYVLNNPVNLTDPNGLKIYLKTGNNATFLGTNIKNPIQDAVHQSIIVDTENGQKAFSFAMSGFGLTVSSEWLGEKSPTFTILKGHIYKADYTGGKINATLDTTPEQDKQFIQYLESRLGEEAGYSVGRHNCRKFSQLMFEKAKELYKGVENGHSFVNKTKSLTK